MLASTHLVDHLAQLTVTLELEYLETLNMLKL
jgi:hypothetical protein